eukprot:TRINITY_DN2733_c0_g1_i4.p2 TRINITY_DN2733_c0_g1~~TRINITY_DN2733_c0_g1_i4.p2  ORF type:complete len:215 (-),score=27.44 TRINITY_DN2733_c0_g1_i4:359-916(-)
MSKQAGNFVYQYPRPALTVDTIIISEGNQDQNEKPEVLLIQRKYAPCKGQWALPGGFVNEFEPLDKAALRELQEETSVQPEKLDILQVGSFGDPGRDPRGWTVTVAYAAIVPQKQLGVKAADDAANAQWFQFDQLPKLAFDHKLILRSALGKLMEIPANKEKQELFQAMKTGVDSLQGDWVPPLE